MSVQNFSENVVGQIQKYVDEVKSSNPEISGGELFDLIMANRDWRAEVASVEIDDEDRCCARIWSGFNPSKGKVQAGYGSRCAKGHVSVDGKRSRFCSKHAKDAAVTETPGCFYCEGEVIPARKKIGSPKGLYFGSWGGDFPFMAADGAGIAIMWKRDEVVKKIRDAMEGGVSYHPNSKEGKAGRTKPPNIPSSATTNKVGSKKVGSKKTTKKTKKPKAAVHRWMSSGNRMTVRDCIIALHGNTGKWPKYTLHLLESSNLDVDLATESFKSMVSGGEWDAYCAENTLEITKLSKNGENVLYTVNDNGDYDGELKHNMIIGVIAELCHAIWKKLPSAEKKPFEDEYAAANVKHLESDMCEAAAKAETTTTQAKKTKKTKKKKLAITEAPATLMESESEEESEEEISASAFEMHDGSEVYVDGDWNAYSEDGDELGKVDPKTKKFI